MKVAIILCLMMATTLALKGKAQTPTFEQTVDYIIQNTKGRVMYPGNLDAYSRIEGYRLEDIKIEQNGKIEFITNQKNKSYGYNNNFSIIFNIFDLVEKVDYPDGIRAYKFLIHFNGLNVSEGYGITFATDADAQKVARALRHLKTLCIKENDLFSRKTDEEKKPQLNKKETIDYLKSKLHHEYVYSGTTMTIYYRIDHTTDDCGIVYSEKLVRPSLRTEKTESYEFNPKYITDIAQVYHNGKPISQIKITVSSNKAKKKIYEYGQSYDANSDVWHRARVITNEIAYTNEILIGIPSDGDLSTDINRIKKAFERLKELCQDEKDPFDN